MQAITSKNVKLLSRSGLVLLLLSMLGSFALAAITTSGDPGTKTWIEVFNLLFLAVLGIATYYLALSAFTWTMWAKKKTNGASV